MTNKMECEARQFGAVDVIEKNSMGLFGFNKSQFSNKLFTSEYFTALKARTNVYFVRAFFLPFFLH